MKMKSWHIDRRELLKGGGIALALPFLNAMGKAVGDQTKAAGQGGLPKRMLVSYFAYGAYMPDGPSGIPTQQSDGGNDHHEWSWWPCRDPGPLSFNQSSAPFAALKDQVSYLSLIHI